MYMWIIKTYKNFSFQDHKLIKLIKDKLMINHFAQSTNTAELEKRQILSNKE